MRVVFRVDASTRIGTGHAMRCLTLAQELRRNGAVCSFICRDHPGNLMTQLCEQGFPVQALPRADRHIAAEPQTGHADWLGADWQTDSQQTLAALSSEVADWLVVDHYALDARWERIVHGACRGLMVIDDLADRPHHCELLLDQNLGRRQGDYSDLVAQHCEILAGPRYALLRPEFAALRGPSTARRKAADLTRILVSLGGVDIDNVTSEVLQGLAATPLPRHARIDVVMGAHAPWLSVVQQLAAQMAIKTRVFVDTKDMARLMSEADLGIGAAGSTSWERCVLGLPALIVVLANNQREAADALARSGAVTVLPTGTSFKQALLEKIGELVQHRAMLQDMSERAVAVCDGTGTAIVAEKLLNTERKSHGNWRTEASHGR